MFQLNPGSNCFIYLQLDEEKRAAGDKKPQLIHGSMKPAEQDSNSNEG